MKKYIAQYKKAGKPLEIILLEIPDWDGFDKLIKFVQENYDAKVIADYDGPGARRWILESRGLQFELIHDDGFGNYFLAPTVESESIVNEIANDIDQRFRSSEK